MTIDSKELVEHNKSMSRKITFLTQFVLYISLLGACTASETNPTFEVTFENETESLDSTARIERIISTDLDAKEILDSLSSIYHSVEHMDTLQVYNGAELFSAIGSNRIILLAGSDYYLNSDITSENIKIPGNEANKTKSGLQIHNLHNLQIVGDSGTRIIIEQPNLIGFSILNSYNIQLLNLTIVYATVPNGLSIGGMLNIDKSAKINVDACTFKGPMAYGIFTNNVLDFNMENTKISGCVNFIFEIQASQNFQFNKTKFIDNNLSVAVMGAFSESSKEITFIDCVFKRNKPGITGNPAFNFRENTEQLENKIVFSNCTFKENKGYVWWGDKIVLDNCSIDSTDFIGLSKRDIE